jgi:hypothetical protein
MNPFLTPQLSHRECIFILLANSRPQSTGHLWTSGFASTRPFVEKLDVWAFLVKKLSLFSLIALHSREMLGVEISFPSRVRIFGPL